MELRVERFEPFSVIEITDAAWGLRKLGLVALSGRDYYDVVDVVPHVTVSGNDAYQVIEMNGQGALAAYPIYEALEPIDVGGVGDWLMEMVDRAKPEEIEAVRRCIDELKTKGIDLLSFLRAARWAVQQRSGDVSAALQAGVSATEKVRKLRAAQVAVAAGM